MAGTEATTVVGVRAPLDAVAWPSSAESNLVNFPLRMSTLVMALCWPLQMPSTAKAVLISLADQSNDQGICWPSIAGIAQRTCFGRSAVMGALKWLEETDLLSIDRTGGRNNHYHLNIGRMRQREFELDGVRRGHPSGKQTGSEGPRNAQPVQLADGLKRQTALTRPADGQVTLKTSLEPVHLADGSGDDTRLPGGPPRAPNRRVPVHLAHPPVRQVDTNHQQPSIEPSKKPKTSREAVRTLDVHDLTEEGVSHPVAGEFLALRRRKKAPLTPLAWDGIKAEAHKAGWTLSEALAKCVHRNWQGFEAAWVAEESRSTAARNGNRQEALEARNKSVGDQWLQEMEDACAPV